MSVKFRVVTPDRLSAPNNNVEKSIFLINLQFIPFLYLKYFIKNLKNCSELVVSLLLKV